MSIELQFVRGNDWQSGLIAWWGSGYGGYSHVDARLKTGELAGARSDVVGGKPAGFQIRPANYESWNKRTLVSIPATEAEENQWLSLIHHKVGCGYDKADIVGLVIGRPLMSKGNWICSASQLDILQDLSKIPRAFPFIAQQISPNTLLAMCCSIGGATFGDQP